MDFLFEYLMFLAQAVTVVVALLVVMSSLVSLSSKGQSRTNEGRLNIHKLNDRIRDGGVSARELWTKRDQFTGQQLPINDNKVISSKYENRLKSHKASSKYRSRGKESVSKPDVNVGDLVYLKSDRDKTKPRDRYIIVEPKTKSRSNTVSLQKFVGSQLRSRVYVVNHADIIKVNEYKFKEYVPENDEDSSEENLNLYQK